MTQHNYHHPVLLKESVAGLDIDPDGVYVDVTFGGGGHSRAILSQLSEQGRLYAFDQDPDAAANALDDPRFQLIEANFKYIKKYLRFQGVQKVNGILADFGVSSHQFDVAERGFSTRYDGPLDMRMNPSEKQGAYQVLNTYSQEDIARIIRQYAEIYSAQKVASAITEARMQSPIETTGQLNEILKPLFSSQSIHKMLARVYQAIRIEVNQELEAIQAFLLQTIDIVKEGGRLSLISYHSLEDRLVKNFIRSGKFEGEVEKDFYGRALVPFAKVGKLIVPTEEENKQNSRARSAKLRIAKRLKEIN